MGMAAAWGEVSNQHQPLSIDVASGDVGATKALGVGPLREFRYGDQIFHGAESAGEAEK
jgi:hypothetical protein